MFPQDICTVHQCLGMERSSLVDFQETIILIFLVSILVQALFPLFPPPSVALYSSLPFAQFFRESISGSGEWERMSLEGSLERQGHSSVVLGNTMAIHGGRSKSGPLSDVHLWSFGNNPFF